MLLKSNQYYSRTNLILCYFLAFACNELFASNDSIAPQISIKIGSNATKTNVISDLELNRDLTKNPGIGLFIESSYSKICLKKIIFETRVVLEKRHTSDVTGLVFTDVVGNSIQQVKSKQNNYCITVSPLLYFPIYNSLYLGIGPSLNYLARSTYKFPDLEGKYQHPNLYYYKKFQPELNASAKVFRKNITFSLDYSMSLMNKVKGNKNAIEEYDHVLRLGIGFKLGKKLK